MLTTAAVAGSLVAGCSFDYPLNAVFLNGRLHFVGAEERWFFGSTGFCPSYFSVRAQSGETVWRIESDLPPTDCRLFPLAYGVAPSGWRTVVPAARLRSGETYILNGHGGDAYHGAFRYTQRRVLAVENEPELARGLPDPPYEWPDQNRTAE